MDPKRWTWTKRARIERSEALEGFAPSSQEAGWQMVSNMRYLTLTGSHPEELPRKRSVRALPVVTEAGVGMYILFTAIGRKYVVLHATLERAGSSTSSQPEAPAFGRSMETSAVSPRESRLRLGESDR